MKIEILKSFKHSDPVTNNFYNGIPEEVWIVSEEFGKYACKMGWARDLSGVVETGEPEKGEIILAPVNSVYSNKVENLNG